MEISDVLLREVTPPVFGENLSKVIELQRKVKIMDSKKVQIYVDGELLQEYITSETVKFEISPDGTTRIDIGANIEKPEELSAEAAIIPVSADKEVYLLSGIDLEEFKKVSPLRNYDKSKTGQASTSRSEIRVIDTIIYNILDVNSVHDALLDLTKKENELLAAGYVPKEYDVPQYIFGQGEPEDFCLRENITVFVPVEKETAAHATQ